MLVHVPIVKPIIIRYGRTYLTNVFVHVSILNHGTFPAPRENLPLLDLTKCAGHGIPMTLCKRLPEICISDAEYAVLPRRQNHLYKLAGQHPRSGHRGYMMKRIAPFTAALLSTWLMAAFSANAQINGAGQKPYLGWSSFSEQTIDKAF